VNYWFVEDNERGKLMGWIPRGAMTGKLDYYVIGVAVSSKLFAPLP
jgi:hypothetical protein